MSRIDHKPLILIVVLLLGCKTTNNNFKSQFNHEGTFELYKSFGFLTDNQLGEHMNYDQLIIQSMIYKRFTAMGYKYQPVKPDLAIGIKYYRKGTRLVTTDQGNLNNWLNYPPVTNPIRPYTTPKETPEGTLSIFIVDLVKRSIVFQSHCNDYQPELPDRMIISSIGRMLDKYKVTTY